MFFKAVVILASFFTSPQARADLICAEGTHVCVPAGMVGEGASISEALLAPKRMCSLINGYRTPAELAERLAYYSECNAAGGIVQVTDTNK